MVVVEEMVWHCGMGIINGGIKELIYTPPPLIYENPNNARYTSDFLLKQLSLSYFRISVLLSLLLLFLVFAFVFRA